MTPGRSERQKNYTTPALFFAWLLRRFAGVVLLGDSPDRSSDVPIADDDGDANDEDGLRCGNENDDGEGE